MAKTVPIVHCDILVWHDGTAKRTVAVGSPAWFLWLNTAASFSFVAPSGTFSALKERRKRGSSYWRAYRKQAGRLRRTYLGRSEHLTAELLNAAAAALARADSGAFLPDSEQLGQAEPLLEDGIVEPLVTPKLEEPPVHFELDPLLRTKLSPPLGRPALVERPHLTGRLSEGLRYGLALISAPAGFGKTTVVGQWSLSSGCPVAWLSLDAADSDPAHFWAYVVASLQTVHPSLGDDTLRVLRSHYAPAVESYLTVLINAIEGLPSDIALVLDDYHLIQNESVHRGMAFLLDHLPRRLHVVIVSRTDPPLPLTRLAARGQLIELRAVDLTFTSEETTSFLNDVMRLGLSGEDVAALQKRTEGWIVGLQMAALSMHRRQDVADFVRSFSGDNRYVVTFFLQEVLAQQSERVRTFLLQTSIAERLSGPLSEALVGLPEGEGQAMLDALETGSLFTVSLDGERGWYRYHHLFASCLTAHLHRTEPGMVRELHRRAAVWFQSQGMVAEAVHHALAAVEHELAANLIEQSAAAMLKRGESATFMTWVRSLPGALVKERPLLCLLQAIVLAYAGQQEAAELWLRDAEIHLGLSQTDWTEDLGDLRRAVQTGLNDSFGSLLVARAAIAVDRRDLPLAIALSTQALEGLPEEEGVIRAHLLFVLGQALWFSGDARRSSETLAKAGLVARASGSLHIAVIALSQLAGIRAIQGQLSAAADAFRQTLSLASAQSQLTPAASESYAGLALLHYEWNDLPTAMRYAMESISLAAGGGMVGDMVLHHRLLARLKQAEGDIEGALAVMDRAEALALTNNLSRELSRIAIYRARFWLKVGNLAAASQWADASGLGEDDEPAYRNEGAHLAIARVRIAQGKPALAIPLLERLLQAAETAGRTGSLIRILLGQALALRAQGETAKALAALETALTLAEPEHYVRTFIDEDAALVPLLSKLLEFRHRRRGQVESAPSSAYLRQLLGLTGQSPTALQHLPALDSLTDRELEVLRLIGRGLESPRIAQELIVSLNTVKAHIKSIYAKLGAHSRTQAIAYARERTLL